MKVSTLLQRARQALIDRGWRQYMYEDECGRMCAVGAVRYADGTGNGDPDCRGPGGDALAAYGLLRSLLPGGHEFDDIVNWNDTHGRTRAEVIELFDTAISAAMSDEAAQ